MGTPGVPWDVPKEDIERALRANKGLLTHTSKALHCSPNTLHRHLKKYPDLLEIQHDLRFGYDESMLDDAEEALSYAINQREDLSNATRSAFYVLNSKGRKRGYIPPQMQVPIDEVKPDPIGKQFTDNIDAIRKLQALPEAGGVPPQVDSQG